MGTQNANPLPLKLDIDSSTNTGQIQQFQPWDSMPNDAQLNYVYGLVQRIILALEKKGITLEDDILIHELNNLTT